MMKKILFLAALLLLLTTASGCRSRTSAAPRASGAQPPAASSDSGAAADGEPEALTENGGETVENPLAERAEYDEAARAELLENQSRAVSGEGEGGGLPLTQKDADSRALQLDSAAELAAVKTLPAEEAERQAAIKEAQADAASGDNTFTTGSGEQAPVEVPAQPDPDPVDWQSQKDTFVAGWATRIDAYLAGSPLAGQGTTFAEAAWAYGVDPRFSPAISAVESSKGLYCFRPHNAWGWGSSSWNTWEDAIWDHVAGLASGYGGHLTYAAAQKYCPPNAARWYSSVLANMERI